MLPPRAKATATVADLLEPPVKVGMIARTYRFTVPATVDSCTDLTEVVPVEDEKEIRSAHDTAADECWILTRNVAIVLSAVMWKCPIPPEVVPAATPEFTDANVELVELRAASGRSHTPAC